MPKIELSRGFMALVDDEDHEVLSLHKWHLIPSKNWLPLYAGRWEPRQSGGDRRFVLMHRQIMAAPHGVQVDHANHDGLDNRRGNLRLCSRSQNIANCPKQTGRSSSYKGVHCQKGRWIAQIRYNSCNIYLGMFASEIEAAGAYDAKARELFGEFAHLNFPATLLRPEVGNTQQSGLLR